ncbi:MAG: hypothetical protein WAW86_01035 [Gammaproteobacteria bacterium]
MLGRYGVLFFSLLMMVAALLVVYFDILPHWQERLALQLLVQKKTSEFEQKKKQREQPLHLAANTEQKENISNLYFLMQQSGLQVKSLELAKKQEHKDAKLLHFSAEAAFSEVQALITVFNQSSNFVLLDFSERILMADRHLFEGDVLLLDRPKKSMVGSELLNVSPFCVSATDYPVKSSLMPSVEGMQVVAYLQQGQKVQAVMRLVDGELLTIEEGQLLGKEQVRVVGIKHEGVVVQFPNGQFNLFKMHRS